MPGLWHNAKYCFDTIVVDSFNEPTIRTAHEIVKEAVAHHNPFCVYGTTRGVGKTHLLYAIRNEASNLYPALHTLYISTEDITSVLVKECVKRMEHCFLEQYCKPDILLIDDFDLLLGKEKTLMSLLLLVILRCEQQKQTVIAWHGQPFSEIVFHYLSKSSSQQLENSSIWNLQIPNFDACFTLLKRDAHEQGYRETLPDEILTYVANYGNNGIRSMRMLFQRVALAFVQGKKTHTQEEVDTIAKKYGWLSRWDF
ncbi:MAG: hypothetical protein COV10_00710 [Candidatus Vogelbacteria bacterium CG10_big_fil_rev_8_21_14_0_10_51_16]|uniref:Chromosomal replication initiator protein DnaA ATPAse domain-containing protein n=1 Tax=Candidatus Vogelbacteria bacterium CG10_big_fil_rev_8_21_14_0_10_51_16 TaxID=1975045 RepID=A0A2H0RF61_9BACT|nr:MAG: hypothetical protein COV10_00710 [Candidatus Vogelbacteria bacterium CG10_big_fil_rev_8_21_14_0_10_51_16]